MLALVTGGNRGIGLAIASILAAQGMDLIITGRNEKTLDSTKKKLEKDGITAWAFVCDVSDDEQVENLASEVAKIGKPDILINNAAVAYYKNFEENSDVEIDEMIDVNLRGLIKMTQAMIPLMDKGLIINISSGAGKTAYAGLAVYCATKFGVIGFTEALAEELEKKGIRAYCICPGDTQTDMWESIMPGRPATYSPKDVAAEVLHLIKNNEKIRPGKAIDVRKHSLQEWKQHASGIIREYKKH
jgi:short-subunit dehydrogenase